jgi:hypothetical protein
VSVDTRKAAARHWGFALLALGLFLGLAIYCLWFVASTYQGLDYKCLVEGPYSPLAVVSEASGIVTGRFGHWPLGRECEWLRADGAGTIVAQSNNWTGSVELLASTGIALSGTYLAVCGSVRPQHRDSCD